MKHFWLNDDQQALMDSATSSADDYGHIFLLDLPSAWKTPIKKMLNATVDPVDQLRIFKVAGTTGHKLNGDTWVRLTSAVRLNAKQATMMKLTYGGSGNAFVVNDPTGENWGNMLIAQHDRHLSTSRYESFGSHDAAINISHLASGKPFGPTLALVGDHCNRLDTGVARAMVWERNTFWLKAHQAVELKTHGVSAKGEPIYEIDRSLFDLSHDTYGRRWATSYARVAQNSAALKECGIALTGRIVGEEAGT